MTYYVYVKWFSCVMFTNIDLSYTTYISTSYNERVTN